MPAKRTRRKAKPAPVRQEAPAITLEIAPDEPTPSEQLQEELEPLPKPVPEVQIEGTYSFQTIARYVSPDGREIRKLEALEKERDPMVVIKSSTRFLDENGNVTACSEAMTTLKGTISALKGGRW